MVGEKGEAILFRPGDFKELSAEPSEALESLIDGFELLRPFVLENSPILSRFAFYESITAKRLVRPLPETGYRKDSASF